MPHRIKRVSVSDEEEIQIEARSIRSKKRYKREPSEAAGGAEEDRAASRNGMGESEAEYGNPESSIEPDDREIEEEEEEEDELEDGGQEDGVPSLDEAGVGVIEKVSLKNFMCHDRLEVSLGPKLNFIIGHNGSGKSAILTGITIALGGKATATSRGNSLKSFVKEGRQSAVVEVTLKNVGEDAFKYSSYPDKIIVERVIGANGSGAWKIKNKDGKIVSTKREELNAICDHANIQVDNPMNILTQDSARQFLSSSHSDEKYQFFLKGTQLAQLSSEYDVIQINQQTISTLIQRKEEGLPLLRQKAQDALNDLEVVVKAADFRKTIEELRPKIVWSVVQEKEDQLGEVSERLERMRIKSAKAEKLRAKAIEDERAHETTITELESTSGENADREAPIIAQMKELREQERGFLTAIRQAKEEESELNGAFKSNKGQIDRLTAQIEAETSKLRDGNQDRRAALQRQQKQADLERKKIEREEADLRDRLSQVELQEIGALDEKLSELDARRGYLRNSVGNAEDMMKKLRVTQTNHMTAYGANIPTLMQMIAKETRWRRKPVGPIGTLIKLKDAQWAPVLESVIGNTLNAFCVTNYHDRTLLQALKTSANCGEIPILTAADEAFDYSMGEPDGSVLTILRVLDIESDYITRQLINSVHIEQCALVNVRSEGDRLMRQRLRNVKFCYSLDMYRLGGGNVGSSSTTLQPHRGPPRLSMDISARLQDFQQKHAQDQDELTKVSQAYDALREEKGQLSDERRQIKYKIPQLQRRAREKHAEMERIGEDLHEDEPANVQAMVEARLEFEEEQQKLPDKLQEVHDRLDETELKIKPLVEERMRLKKMLEQMQEASRSLKPKLEKAAADRLQAHSHGLHWERELAKFREKEEDLAASVTAYEKDVELHTARAEAIWSRVPTDKKPAEYEKMVEGVERQLEAAARRHGGESAETVKARVQQCHESFEKATMEIDALKVVNHDLREALIIRLQKWRRFRRVTAIRARNMFTHYLSQRGYSGELTFDHNKGTLRLMVRTEEGSSGHQDKDPKSLSGGEKSFATICLLLALWDSIGCPIRCLDEFDVFMDAVNRRISMSMMVEAARHARGVQYVLITPQSMANVPLGNDVRVHRLSDPERNQTTLTQG